MAHGERGSMAKPCPCAGAGAGINSVFVDTPRGSVEPAEERELPAAAERELPRRQTNRLLAGRQRAFDRDIGNTAVAARLRGVHRRVAAVEVVPAIEPAAVVDNK